MTLIIPERLAATCHGAPERVAWLEQLPDAIRALQDTWSLSLGAPFDGNEVSCAWVALAVRSDGTRAVLKLGMPHMEGAHEIQGLRFWGGDPTVRLLDADESRNAMLLERCEPGTALRLPPPHTSSLARASASSSQLSRGSAARRANIHSRARSASTSRRSAKRRMVVSGSARSRALQLKRCWVAS